MATRKPRVDPALSAFARNDKSPFADKYDLDGEKKVLADLLKKDEPDPAHPLFGRLQLYYERADELRQMQAEHQARGGADKLVPLNEARQIRNATPLVNDGQDAMELHTVEAMRLFLGRARDPSTNAPPISGGKRVAAALRSLWSLSSNDNPYADWALIDISERIANNRAFIRLAQANVIARLDEMKAKGIGYSILKARETMRVNLGFASPYGYMIAMLIVEIDYLTRVIKSAQTRDLLANKHAYEILTAAKHKCRSAFERALFWQRWLLTEEMMTLSRIDFLPTADEAGQARVALCKQKFGEVPKSVFMGETQPRHSKRKLRLTPAELQLLDSVPLVDDRPGKNPIGLITE